MNSSQIHSTQAEFSSSFRDFTQRPPSQGFDQDTPNTSEHSDVKFGADTAHEHTKVRSFFVSLFSTCSIQTYANYMQGKRIRQELFHPQNAANRTSLKKKIPRSSSTSRILVGTPVAASSSALFPRVHTSMKPSPQPTWSNLYLRAGSPLGGSNSNLLDAAGAAPKNFIPRNLSTESTKTAQSNGIFSTNTASLDCPSNDCNNEGRDFATEDGSLDLQALYDKFVHDEDEDDFNGIFDHGIKTHALPDMHHTIDNNSILEDISFLNDGDEYQFLGGSDWVQTSTIKESKEQHINPATLDPHCSTTEAVSPELCLSLPAISAQHPRLPPSKFKYIFSKAMTRSDVGKLGRIILPRADAEKYFPYFKERSGLSLVLHDVYGRQHECTLKYWLNGAKSSQKRMYLIDLGHQKNAFFSKLQIRIGSLLDFYVDDQHRYVIDSRFKNSLI